MFLKMTEITIFMAPSLLKLLYNLQNSFINFATPNELANCH